MSFSTLKKSRKKSIEKLTKKLQSENQKQNYKDDRFWYPQRDEKGNGFAIIRFLPAPEGEDMPWQKTFSHGFKDEKTGLWYIEECPTTIGQKCPCCEANSELWNTGDEASRDVARKRKRRLSYISNVYVVRDTENPENEGKVFLYKFGKKIFGKLERILSPEFPDEEPIDPFDLWDGADFKLKIRKVDGYVNYDESEFAAPAPLGKDDKEREAIWKQAYPLNEFVDESKFKPYGELKKQLNRVLGKTYSPGPHASVDENKEAAAPKNKNESSEPETDTLESDMDESLAYYEGLAEEQD